MKILLVEDNPLMEQVISRFLVDQGYGVVVANCARDGLDLARTHQFSLLLIDMLLPDQNGSELLEALRTLPHYATCPAIALSGMGEEQRACCQQAGFCDYLTKPFDLDDLLTIVQQNLKTGVERVIGV